MYLSFYIESSLFSLQYSVRMSSLSEALLDPFRKNSALSSGFTFTPNFYLFIFGIDDTAIILGVSSIRP